MIIASSFTRTITAPDADGALIPTWVCAEGCFAYLSALAAAPNSKMSGRIFAFTGARVLVAISAPITFSAASGPPDYGLQWSGTPSFPAEQNIEGVGQLGWKCDTLTGGPWTVACGIAYKVA